MKLSRTAGDLVELGCCLAKHTRKDPTADTDSQTTSKAEKRKLRHITQRQLTNLMDNVKDNNKNKITLVIEDKTP